MVVYKMSDSKSRAIVLFLMPLEGNWTKYTWNLYCMWIVSDPIGIIIRLAWKQKDYIFPFFISTNDRKIALQHVFWTIFIEAKKRSMEQSDLSWTCRPISWLWIESNASQFPPIDCKMARCRKLVENVSKKVVSDEMGKVAGRLSEIWSSVLNTKDAMGGW